MVCAWLSYQIPQYVSLFRIGYVAALATKLSDTFASEIGKAYGKSTYLITTLRSVPRGTEGAVSLEGTVAGMGGSLLIALLGSGLQIMPKTTRNVVICIASALLATTAESYIGAVYQNEQYPWLSNELVNFIMTVIGSSIAMALSVALRAA
jgi:uncharacterized protein (TIGR00297 family)